MSDGVDEKTKVRLAKWRGWLRRRILWFDWQRQSKRHLILGKGETLKEARSYAYHTKDQKPGTYIVELPFDLAESVHKKPGEWRAQFGRRIAKVESCDFASVGKTEATRPVTCKLAVDLQSSRSVRRSPDGVFPGDTAKLGDQSPTEAVTAMYAEVSAAWRQLTEVRFKLLALLPVVSGVGLFQLLSPSSGVSSAPRWAKALMAGFGVVVTAALLIYERRNSELYGDLISRGKHLEHHLGANSGVFLGRLGGRWPVRHDVALFLIYGATLLAWATVFVAVLAGALEAEVAAQSSPLPIVESDINATVGGG